MFIRKVGPIWAPENEGAGGAGAGAGGGEGNQNAGDNGGAGSEGSEQKAAGEPFAALDEDTRTWLQTKGMTDVAALAKSARESERLIGDRIKIPGKDATQEEKDKFLNLLGRPEKEDDYQFTAPKDLPEGLPYDGEKAKAFKGMAHKLGLNNEQATALHDFYINEQLEGFKGATANEAAKLQAKAESATADLVKLWGPLDGATAAANFEIADKIFTQTPGGQELLAELKELKLVGPNKEIYSAPLAKMLSALGTALYTEDGILRGAPDAVGNPFAEGEHFNVTQQMQLAKADPERARSLIAAAGKKPSDFGLT